MKNNFKRYLIECRISLVIVCVLIAICFSYIENDILFYGVLIILVLSEKMCIRFFAQKNIYSTIFKDLNPKLFLSVEDNKYFSLHPLYKSLGKMCIGDYQDAVNICTFKIKQNKKSKEAYLANLARIYFELDDIDSLSKICREFDIALEKT